MSATAEKILQQFKSLPASEQTEVSEKITTLRTRQLAWEEQRAKLRAMQARNKESGLLKQLLADRAAERSRG